ncbi:hypothetical protein B0H16DRAFT_1733482 [Mycena metata]|uniref:Uncharacterized protein n=1 Tax=Mycena metata TaxID=1033252 RepID=A0AAD7MT92_9AGAR|nr:hypothetical protein B0H16DRAFT_1733482 [Mycena metata]
MVIEFMHSVVISWGNYALLAAAVVYIYDFTLTWHAEANLLRWSGDDPYRWAPYFLHLVPLRYFALTYQITVIYGTSLAYVTPQRSSVLHYRIVLHDSDLAISVVET